MKTSWESLEICCWSRKVSCCCAHCSSRDTLFVNGFFFFCTTMSWTLEAFFAEGSKKKGGRVENKSTHNRLLRFWFYFVFVKEARMVDFDKDGSRRGTAEKEAKEGASYFSATKKDKTHRERHAHADTHTHAASQWDSCSKWNTWRLHGALQGYSILIRVLETSFIRLSLISPTHLRLKHSHANTHAHTHAKKEMEKKKLLATHENANTRPRGAEKHKK